jgi:transposase-like protein
MSGQNLFDDGEVELPCPKCARKTKRTLGRLRREKKFKCAGCGSDVDVDTKELEQSMRSIGQSFDSLKRSLRRF